MVRLLTRMTSDLLTSRLTTKYQATIPKAVRTVLGLKAGDTVRFEIAGNQVSLRKATLLDLQFAQALEGTLASEWLSPHDEEAYADL